MATAAAKAERNGGGTQLDQELVNGASFATSAGLLFLPAFYFRMKMLL
jgi:hypothetical protein